MVSVATHYALPGNLTTPSPSHASKTTRWQTGRRSSWQVDGSSESVHSSMSEPSLAPRSKQQPEAFRGARHGARRGPEAAAIVQPPPAPHTPASTRLSRSQHRLHTPPARPDSKPASRLPADRCARSQTLLSAPPPKSRHAERRHVLRGPVRRDGSLRGALSRGTRLGLCVDARAPILVPPRLRCRRVERQPSRTLPGARRQPEVSDDRSRSKPTDLPAGCERNKS
eukprot:2074148-Rhodomonas_salina.1